MYAQLSSSEKDFFTCFYTRFLLSGFGDRKIKPYKRDNPKFCYDKPLEESAEKFGLLSEGERLTLQQWVNSIIKPIQRQGQTRACDLLAPPPHTSRDYSMGLVEIGCISHSHALIEARGYANLELDGQKITIDNFSALIDSKSEHFFKLGNQFIEAQRR